MGKRNRKRDDDDDDDFDDDDMPDMSSRARPPPSSGAGAPSSGASPASSAGMPLPSPQPATSAGMPQPPPPPQAERWQDVLTALLKKTLPQFPQGRGSCPFTREGLAALQKADPELYNKLRRLSQFDLCVDPSSPQTQIGGHCFCEKHSIQKIDHLIQHCGVQHKTASIARNPPAAGDDTAWGKFLVREQLHYVLLQVLNGTQALAPVQHRERVQADQGQAIVWPPMVHVRGLDRSDHSDANSEAKLKEKFAKWAPSSAYPIWRGAFQGEVVLLFATPHDDHYRAFDMAQSLAHENRDARLVEWREFVTWRERSPRWAERLVKRHSYEQRWLADEKARQNERVKELARRAEEAQRTNVVLAAEGDLLREAKAEQERLRDQERLQHEAQQRQWEAETAEIKAKYARQLGMLQQEQAERKRADDAYKAHVDRQMQEHFQNFEKYASEMEMQQQVLLQQEQNLQQRLLGERAKLGHLLDRIEVKERSERQMRDEYDRQLQQAEEGLASLGESSDKERLRLQIDIEAKEKQIAELQARAERDREAEEKELKARRCECDSLPNFLRPSAHKLLAQPGVVCARACAGPLCMRPSRKPRPRTMAMRTRTSKCVACCTWWMKCSEGSQSTSRLRTLRSALPASTCARWVPSMPSW